MANEEQLALIRQGMQEWNQWRLNHSDIPIDMTKANLQKANLMGYNLQDADLRGTNLASALLWYTDLQRANLTSVYMGEANLKSANLAEATLTRAQIMGAQLIETNLRGASLQEAKLQSAHLHNANLMGTDLTGVDLRETIFSHATLTGMTVTNALLWQTQWIDVDLRKVIDLEAVRYLGPSTIGIDTLIASHGQISDAFLRGCGVSDDLIEFAHTLAHSPQYFSLYLSYGPEDEALGTRLYDDLQAHHVRCWKYPRDLKLGELVQGRIALYAEQVVRAHQKLVVLIPKSDIRSDWLPDEIIAALKQEEQEQKDILVPIMLDKTFAHNEAEWAQQLRVRHTILDFSGWEHSSTYAVKFDQLLQTLQQAHAAD